MLPALGVAVGVRMIGMRMVVGACHRFSFAQIFVPEGYRKP
jgi:hypothetical protein